MGNDLFSYLERLEIMVFFAGYAFIYAIVFFLAGEYRKQQRSFIELLPKLLPYAYALTGTLFLGYIVKKVYVGNTMGVSISQLNHPYLMLWGILAILFWMPTVAKRPLLSLIHSLVFFYFIPRDIYLYLTGSAEKDVIKNDMNIFTSSLMLNAATLLMVLLMYYLLRYIKDRPRSH
jgi:hypothetical protein